MYSLIKCSAIVDRFHGKFPNVCSSNEVSCHTNVKIIIVQRGGSNFKLHEIPRVPLCRALSAENEDDFPGRIIIVAACSQFLRLLFSGVKVFLQFCIKYALRSLLCTQIFSAGMH